MNGAPSQQLAQQMSKLSSFMEQMPTHTVVADSQGGRPKVLVDLDFFQSLLQTVTLFQVNEALRNNSQSGQQHPAVAPLQPQPAVDNKSIVQASTYQKVTPASSHVVSKRSKGSRKGLNTSASKKK